MTPCRCGIDIHAHVVPETFPSYLPQLDLPGWPSMAPAQACHRHVVINGKNYRTVNERCWSVPHRVADMATMQLRLQAVSPMPELFCYWIPAHAANELLRYINDQIAAMVAASDGELVGLGAVPLQDLALAELHRTKRDLGFGDTQIMIGTDYPFNFHDRTPVRRIREALPDPAQQDRLTHGNARRFLGLAMAA